jgi:hypothetical protein
MMTNLRVVLVVLVAALLLQQSSVGEAQGTTFYVATNGSDSNPGTQGAPWRSVQKAANTLGAGQTALIRGGTYSEKGITFRNSGYAGGPITLRGYPGERPIIDGGYTTSSGLVPVFRFDARDYITLDGLVITRGSGANVNISTDAAARGITIENSELLDFVTDDNSASIWIGTGGADEIVIRNNVIRGRISGGRYNNVANGIVLFRGLDVTIENNDISNVVNGIYYKHSNPGSMTTIVRNNAIHNVSERGILWAMHDATIENNVIYNAGLGIGVFEESASCDALLSGNNHILHNTLVDILIGVDLARSGSCPGAVDTLLRDNLVFNFTNGEYRGISIYAYRSPDSSRTSLVRNLVYSAAFPQPIRVTDAFYALTSLPATVSASGNIAAAPVFENYSSRLFALVGGPGKGAASDGRDIGAEMCTVGVNAPCFGGTAPPSPTPNAPATPSAPTNLRIIS